MGGPYLSIQHLNKDFQTSLFQNLNLSIEKGKIISLAGPSGCGKTTLLRCIAGLERCEGSIIVDGVDVSGLKPEERSIGFVFQEPLLFPHMNVLQNITYGLKMQKVKRSERIERGHELLKKVGLEKLGKRYPHQLSGGQKQRVALARTLTRKPKIVLLDEPFSMLDPVLRQELRCFVRDLFQNEKITAIFVTHDKVEAEYMGDVTVVMNEGKVQQIGTSEQLRNEPVNAFVASFFGDGLVLKEGYVPLSSLKVLQRNDLKMVNSSTYMATVHKKTYLYGNNLYHFYIEELDQHLSLPLADQLGENELVYISYSKSSLLHFKPLLREDELDVALG
ncbi:ABC transporter ATP-binding protein [Bacillus solimangrovi]|uniref:Carnitine transport ATP-binding protein OpuCA n=1 Tax=Bacillus solimangrovi TaxID=1305675 RepID=A0A1E5LDT2_9BACI|nr:ABC transporter ATP-binding protein [Bacillus solimangrovi]OEH92224.1 hypothetical protein BFG57_02855 [Bacillus solimangrovi]